MATEPPVEFKDLPDTTTPLNAATLNPAFQGAFVNATEAEVAAALAQQYAEQAAAPADDQIATLIQASSSATRQQLDALQAQTLRGANGGRYRVVAGVLRNTGSGWAPIDDADHHPMNMGAVTYSADSGGQIVVDYTAIGATKVVSLVVTPDETLARAGFFAGASVTQQNTTIRLARVFPEYADQVSYSGTAWTSALGVFTGLSFSAGVLTLTHPDLTLGTDQVPQLDISVVGRGGTYVPNVGSAGLSSTAFPIEFRDWAGALVTTANTNMRAYVKRGGGIRSVDPAVVTTTQFPASNLWVFGVFEVAN